MIELLQTMGVWGDILTTIAIFIGLAVAIAFGVVLFAFALYILDKAEL